MRIVVMVSGGGTNLQAIMDAIKTRKITDVSIAAVVSNKKDAYALERAKQFGVPGVCVSPKDYENREAFDAALLDTVKSYEPDLVVLAGFLVVLAPSFIRAFEGKIINIHPSLIPSFCGDGFYGLHVHEAALARGVKVTGATVHFVDEGTDTGPIIAQKAVYIEPDDTPETLQRRVMVQAEWVILPQAIDDIAHGRI